MNKTPSALSIYLCNLPPRGSSAGLLNYTQRRERATPTAKNPGWGPMRGPSF